MSDLPPPPPLPEKPPTPVLPPNTAGLDASTVASTSESASGSVSESSLEASDPEPRKGPLSFLSGALTSGLLAWGSLIISQRVVAWYALHPPHYSKPIAQSIGTAMKTLIVGMSFLATFTFAFVALGLFLVFLRSLVRAGAAEPS
jgi:hypothetical protein